MHDQLGQPRFFYSMIGKDPDQPGYARFRQRRVRIRGVDHDDFGLEGDAQRNVRFGPVDRTHETEHALVGELRR